MNVGQVFYITSIPQTNQRKIVRDYETKESRLRRGAFLDPNHTHFLLVDDGMYLISCSAHVQLIWGDKLVETKIYPL